MPWWYISPTCTMLYFSVWWHRRPAGGAWGRRQCSDELWLHSFNACVSAGTYPLNCIYTESKYLIQYWKSFNLMMWNSKDEQFILSPLSRLYKVMSILQGCLLDILLYHGITSHSIWLRFWSNLVFYALSSLPLSSLHHSRLLLIHDMFWYCCRQCV